MDQKAVKEEETQRLVETIEPADDQRLNLATTDVETCEESVNNVAPSEGSGSADQPAQIVDPEETEVPRIAGLYFLLSQSRMISLLLGVIIAIVAGLFIYNDHSGKETHFRKCMGDAELLEYDNQDERAALVWHQAIDLATSLGDKTKLLADLYVRASMAEHHAAYQIHDKLARHPKYDIKVQAAMEKSIDYQHAQEIKDLRSALSHYEKIPNTTFEQITTLGRMTPLIWEDIPDLDILGSRSATFVVPSFSKPAKESTSALERGLSDLQKKRQGLGLLNLRKYLHDVRDSSAISNEVLALTHTVRSSDSRLINDLIPVFHELIYYNQGTPSDLRYAEEWLEWLLRTSGKDPFSFDERLNLANQAYSSHDYHGAIVECLRCLGIKNDQNVQDKLIASLRLARAADLGDSDRGPEFTTILTKSINLEQRSFGKENQRVRLDTHSLAVVNGITNNFKDAESTLKSFKVVKDEYPSDWEIAFNLADVYAKQGKCDQAVAQYHAGQELEKKESYSSPQYGTWARIANAYIVAGRYAEALPAMKRASEEKAPDIFGSSSGEEPAPFMD